MNERMKAYLVKPTGDGRVQFFRSLIVGGIASVVDVAIVTLCFEILKMTDLQSTAAGFAIGLLVNFLLTRMWVFTGSRMSGLVEFVTFAVIGLLGLGLSLLIVWVFTHPIADARPLGDWLTPERYLYPGKLTAIVVVFFWNFLLRKFVIYRK